MQNETFEQYLKKLKDGYKEQKKALPFIADPTEPCFIIGHL